MTVVLKVLWQIGSSQPPYVTEAAKTKWHPFCYSSYSYQQNLDNKSSLKIDPRNSNQDERTRVVFIGRQRAKKTTKIYCMRYLDITNQTGNNFWAIPPIANHTSLIICSSQNMGWHIMLHWYVSQESQLIHPETYFFLGPVLLWEHKPGWLLSLTGLKSILHASSKTYFPFPFTFQKSSSFSIS